MQPIILPVPFTPHPHSRPVGYAVVAIALALLVFAAWFVVREVAIPPRIVRVHFPEIATLGEGDPVVQGGVPVGKVVSIRLTGSEALVEIELFHHRPLAADARFVNFSHSLMGARKVWIVPGVSPLPLDESRIQEGFFQPGLPETLHRVDSLVIIIDRVRQEAEALLTENNPLLSPMTAALTSIRHLDSTAVRLGKIAGRLESARSALEAGVVGIRAAEPPLNKTLRQAKVLLDAVESVQENLDTLLGRLEKVAALAGDSTRTGELLNNDVAYQNLEKSVRVLEKAARLLTKEGLADSVKIKPRLRNR